MPRDYEGNIQWGAIIGVIVVSAIGVGFAFMLAASGVAFLIHGCS